MAVPGLIIFTLAGTTGQLVLNALDRWRVRYIFEHEDEWKENSRLKELQQAENGGAPGEGGFKFMEGSKQTKSSGFDERTRRLREEIGKLNRDIARVEEEMVLLAAKPESERDQNGK